MENEYDPRLDSKSAIRSGNAVLRDYLNKATAAVKRNDWQMAAACYDDIAALATSLRNSAEHNYELQT